MSQSPQPLEYVEYGLIAASLVGLIALATANPLMAVIPTVFTVLALAASAFNRYRADRVMSRRVQKLTQDLVAQNEYFQQENVQVRNFATALVKQTMAAQKPELPAASGELVSFQSLEKQVGDQQRLMNAVQTHISGVEGTIANLVEALDGAAIPNRVEYLEQAIVKLSQRTGLDPNEILGAGAMMAVGGSGAMAMNNAMAPPEMFSLADLGLDELSANLSADLDNSPTRMQGLDSGFLKDPGAPSIEKIEEDLISGDLLGIDPISGDLASGDLTAAELEGGDLWMRPIWELKKTLLAHTDWVRCLSFTPDNQTLISGSFDQSIKLWNMADGKMLHDLQDHHKGVFALAVSADGKTLASGSWDETIKLWNISGGELISNLSGHTASVRSLATSPDNQFLVSGSFDNTVRVWQLSTGDLVKTMMHKEPIAAIALNHTGQILASTGDDGLVKLWSLQTGETIAQLTGNSNCICSLAISPNSTTVVAGTVSGSIVLWSLDMAKIQNSDPLQKFKAHSGQINACVFHPSGQYLITGSVDGKARIWSQDVGFNLLREKPRKTLRGEPGRSVMSAAVSADGKSIAIGGADGTIELWQG
jgi:WD domain, G-beta repeat